MEAAWKDISRGKKKEFKDKEEILFVLEDIIKPLKN